MTGVVPLLTADGLTVEFGNSRSKRRDRSKRAVYRVDLSVGEGECLGLVGESGSGKSTIARTIVGLVSPTAGSVVLDGIDVHRARGEGLRTLRQTVQMIFQDPLSSLNPRMTVGKLIAEAVELRETTSGSKVDRVVAGLLDEVGLAESYAQRFPAQLSGGEAQRVAIARALAVKPRLLICDEPTSALDVSVQDSILTLFQDLQRTGDRSLVFITHDLGVVSSVADRVLVMRDGEVVEEGPTQAVLANPSTAYTSSLVAAASTPELDMLTSGGADRRDTTLGDPPARDSEPLLDVSNLSVSYAYGDPPAVDDVSISVWPGERVGIIGESGSGKTTLGRAALRLLDVEAAVSKRASIRFNGIDLLSLSNREMAPYRGGRLAPIFQNPSSALNPSFRVGSQLLALARIHKGLTGDAARSLAIESLRRAELHQPEEVVRKYPHQLSGGMCQRTFVAMALICGPDLVIADEPTSALDVTVQDNLLTTLEKLNDELSMTFLLITHDMGVIARFCERVYVMKEGKVVEYGRVEEVFAMPTDPYTRSLLAATPRLRLRGEPSKDGTHSTRKGASG